MPSIDGVSKHALRQIKTIYGEDAAHFELLAFRMAAEEAEEINAHKLVFRNICTEAERKFAGEGIGVNCPICLPQTKAQNPDVISVGITKMRTK